MKKRGIFGKENGALSIIHLNIDESADTVGLKGETELG